MKKTNLISYYSFLGKSIKMSALSDKQTRDEFIKFFRDFRKIVNSIMGELNAPDGHEAKEIDDEIRKDVLEEEYEGTLPKIKEDTLLQAIAESGVDVPIIAVITELEPFLI